MVTRRGTIFDPFLEKDRPRLHQARRYLLRPEYVPAELPHRKAEIQQIAGILHVALRGERPSNLLLFGKPGTGKTAVVKHVLREIRTWVEDRTGTRFVEAGGTRPRSALDDPENDSGHLPANPTVEGYRTVRGDSDGPALNLLYMNCTKVDTEYSILAHVANLLVEKWRDAVPSTGWPVEKVYGKVRERVDAAGGVTLVVLDEIDHHVRNSGDDVLYHLTNLNEDLAFARLSIIGISNDARFLHRLEPRVKTRLGEEKIVFPPYDAHQLQDILARRAVEAFVPGVLDDGVVPLCAALAAQEDGDARRALDTLRVAGELAEREASSRITERHVHRATHRLEMDVVQNILRQMPIQTKLLLLAIIAEGATPLTTGAVYASYVDVCRRAGLKELGLRRIGDLLTELDVSGIIQTKLKSFGRGGGRTRLVLLEVSPEETRQVLAEDPKLADLANYRRSQTKLV